MTTSNPILCPTLVLASITSLLHYFNSFTGQPTSIFCSPHAVTEPSVHCIKDKKRLEQAESRPIKAYRNWIPVWPHLRPAPLNLLQCYWPTWCFSSLSGTLLPQDLCLCYLLCLESSSLYDCHSMWNDSPLPDTYIFFLSAFCFIFPLNTYHYLAHHVFDLFIYCIPH